MGIGFRNYKRRILVEEEESEVKMTRYYQIDKYVPWVDMEGDWIVAFDHMRPDGSFDILIRPENMPEALELLSKRFNMVMTDPQREAEMKMAYFDKNPVGAPTWYWERKAQRERIRKMLERELYDESSNSNDADTDVHISRRRSSTSFGERIRSSLSQIRSKVGS